MKTKFTRINNLFNFLNCHYNDAITASKVDTQIDDSSMVASISVLDRATLHNTMVIYVHIKGTPKATQTLTVWKGWKKIARFDVSSWKATDITNCALTYLPSIN